MPSRPVPFVDQGVYHIYNRGVNKQNIFLTDQDRGRFLETLYYYQFSGPKPKFSIFKRFDNKVFENNPKIVEIICYCLMPNHFHLMIKQLKENGVVEFMGKLSNSYTKYYNTKHNRSGYLLQGEFKSVCIESDEQLLHTSRYIHLNPLVADLTKDLSAYLYSSYPDYVGITNGDVCKKEQIMAFFKTSAAYKEFVEDYESYARELHYIKHLLIDLEE